MSAARYPTFEALYDSRKNNFNFFRLLFAMLVIYSHAYPLIYGSIAGVQAEPLHRWSGGQIDFGALAVDGFFMISGFLLVGSWQNSHGILNFCGRRVLRIYPGLIACMAFCVFVVGPLGGVDLKTYFTNPESYRLFEYVFMRNFWNGLPGAFPGNHIPEVINSSLWTIKFEIFCYGCLALMGLARLVKPVPVLVAFAVILGFYNLLVFRDMQPLFPLGSLPKVAMDFLLDPMPRLFSFFLAGSVFYLWRSRIPQSFPLFLLSVVLVLVCLRHALYITLPICGGYALFYLSLAPRLHFPWLGTHDFSYGVYLYAWPVEQLAVYYHVIGSSHPLSLFLLVLPPVFLLAVISWLFVEKPALRLKKKKLGTLQISPAFL